MELPAHQLTMTVLMTPETVNFAGNVHGGHVLKLLDQVAYACGSRYASVIRLDWPGLVVCDADHGCQVARSAVDGMAPSACPSCFAARTVAGA